MDAFYVGVELMRRPELRGKPVIVAGSGPRAVVTTASYEARRFGVGSAMPAARARRLCPEAIFLPPDFEAYRAMSQRGHGRACAPRSRPSRSLGLDEAYLDLTGIDVAARGDAPAGRRDPAPTPAWAARSASARTGSWRRSPPTPRSPRASSCSRASRRASASPAPAAAAARHRRRRPPSGSRRSGSPTIAQLAATPPRRWPSASAAALGPYLRARGALRGRRPVSRRAHRGLRVARDDLPDRHRRPRRAGRGPAPARRRAVRGAGQARPPRAHDRDQGAPRRLHDRHPRPHDPGADQRRRGRRATSPARCCASTRRRGPCGCSACAWRRSPSRAPRPATTTRRSSRSRS